MGAMVVFEDAGGDLAREAEREQAEDEGGHVGDDEGLDRDEDVEGDVGFVGGADVVDENGGAGDEDGVEEDGADGLEALEAGGGGGDVGVDVLERVGWDRGWCVGFLQGTGIEDGDGFALGVLESADVG